VWDSKQGLPVGPYALWTVHPVTYPLKPPMGWPVDRDSDDRWMTAMAGGADSSSVGNTESIQYKL